MKRYSLSVGIPNKDGTCEIITAEFLVHSWWDQNECGYGVHIYNGDTQPGEPLELVHSFTGLEQESYVDLRVRRWIAYEATTTLDLGNFIEVSE